LTKTGAGTLTLSGTNTYTGNTTISAGGLTTSGAAKIADTSAVSVASGAILTLGGDETIGSLSSAGSVALGSYTLTTGAKNTSTTFSGILSGSGGLTKTGSGTFTLSGTNTYTGSTTISAGGLTTNGVARIADTSAVSVASGATFTVGGAETIGSLAGAGTVVLGANKTLTAGGDNTSTTFSGVVKGTGGGLAKAGTGMLTLSGTDTYSGATSVNAGTLSVNGALSNTSTVTVASGATLGGTGSIGTVGASGAVTVQSGGTLGPGNSAGTLTLNNGLTAASGSTLSMELNGTTAGSGYDQIVVKGSVNVSSATLVTNFGFTPAVGDSFTLIDNDGTDTIIGTLKVAGNSIAEGGTFSQGGKIFQVSYIGGTGNDLVLSVAGNVPVIDTSDPPAPPVVVNPPAPTVKDDGDNIPPEKESAVPTLPPGNGGTAVVGDGNGDGKADSEQANVTSVPFLKTDTAQSAPGDAKPVYVTLVSDSVAGKADTTQTQTSVLKEVQQLDAPAGKPTDLDMPLGQISFKAQVAGAGVQENFSLYVDGDVAVNGYWKQNSAGAWVNLASAQYGGKVVSEGGKTRLDFQIVDGGEFDDDGKADGIISDPGAPGYRAVADSDNDQFPDALETMHGLKVGVKDNNVFGSNKLFVMELYRDILFREADSGGQAYWQTRMDSGELNRAQVASMFMDSVESEGGARGIAHLYFGALGRLPDAATLDFLMDKRLSGTSLVGMADSLVAGAEFAGKFTAQDNTGFVNQLYQNVLHRAPEQAGIDYWTHQLAAGARRGEVLLGFTESAEFKAASDHYVTVGLNYLELLGRAPEQAGLESWRGLLDQGTAEVTIVGGFMAAPEYHDRFLS
jgi:autotransporter-associated beta strand protein